MAELEKALAEIALIRSQMARSTEFRGFGAPTLAATGLVAVAGGVGQALWVPQPPRQGQAYLLLWVGVAAISVALITAETLTRTARTHLALGQEMIMAAVEQFLPAA